MRMLAVTCLLALASCTTTPRDAARAAADAAETQRELQAELAGLVPGEPSDCLPLSLRTTVASEVYGPTIVYTVTEGLKFRSETGGGCEPAENGQSVIVTVTPTGRLCRGDIVRTVDRITGIPTGSCSFGPFVPYRKPS